MVWINDSARVLVDAGSGSSVQFGAAGATFESLEVILLSHLRTDHPPICCFVKGGYFTDREKDLIIMGPRATTYAVHKRLCGVVNREKWRVKYLSSYTIVGQDDYSISTKSIVATTFEQQFNRNVNDSVSVEAMTVNHGPIPALAWKVKANGCEAVFSGDTNDKQGNLARFAKNADLLVLHNAIGDDAGQVAKNLHMTPTQIIDIAAQSNAKQIVLSHIMKHGEPGLMRH